MKYCPGCCSELSLESFHKNANSKDGYQGWCKNCKNAGWKSSRKYDSKTAKKDGIYYRYKLTIEQYSAMILSGCEVCGTMENLHIDHDHNCCNGVKTCGKCIRGILCINCNQAEGKLKSNPQLVLNLYTYLTTKK